MIRLRAYQERAVEEIREALNKYRRVLFCAPCGIGFAVNYKKQARVVQYAPDGTYERTWKIEGVWPSQVSYGDLSNTDGNPKEISITLQYDKAILTRG